MKMKEKSKKVDLTLNIQKTKIMASSPNISWQINGGGNGNIDRFYSLRLQNHYKITMDGDCNHEIKRCLLLGRKAMTDPDSILKSGDITLPTRSV